MYIEIHIQRAQPVNHYPVGEMRHYNILEALSFSPWCIMCSQQIKRAQKLELSLTMLFFIGLVHMLVFPWSLWHSLSRFILAISES